ncbi:hypothetical protein ILYODFUR_003793 [Ilyodon furcidens]|uniref:Uncharacterized protein n=1 Tax=Ilyodon furcidens TaxID=33524 RepID=A0ABV0TRM1_9TELE
MFTRLLDRSKCNVVAIILLLICTTLQMASVNGCLKINMEPNEAQSGLIFSVMDHSKVDDRNTGCIHIYYFIRHLHLHFESQEAEQSQIKKEEKSHKLMNHKKKNILNKKTETEQ